MITKHAETTLILGATGFLGHYVVRDLLTKGERLVAVVRPPREQAARRLVSMLAATGMDVAPYLDSGQLILAEGRLPDRLPESTWGRTDAILNCAASLDLFSNGNGEPFSTNVAGTEAVVDWAVNNDIIRMYHVSTAYTCGWNLGPIREDYHTDEPQFQTDYERSKWQAELILEEWAAWIGHSLTIFRPSFLVGDSRTGRTTQFGGFYQFARMISDLKERFFDPNNGEKTHIPLRIPGRPEDAHDIVPVDFVSRIIAEVITRPDFHGRIFHLTNPTPPTNDVMKGLYEEYFGLCGGSFADPNDLLGKFNDAEAMLWEKYQLVTSRIMHCPRFENANTREVMAVAGVEFPRLDRERVFTLFDYAARREWGRTARRSSVKL